MSICILIPLLVGIISAILGYLLGRYCMRDWKNKARKFEVDYNECKNSKLGLMSKFKTVTSNNELLLSEENTLKDRINGLESELSLQKTKNTTLETDYNECKKNKLDLGLNLKTVTANNQLALSEDSKLKDRINALETDLSSQKTKNTGLEKDYNECKKSKLDLELNLKTVTTNNQLFLLKESKLQDKITALESDLSSENTKTTALENDLKLLKNSNTSKLDIVTPASLTIFNSDAAKVVLGKKIKENDLTIVEGIGPKIQELFHNHDIKTWLALSECSIEKCKKVLESGGKRFQMHNPRTWAKQASFAVEGKWVELKKWQDELDGGN